MSDSNDWTAAEGRPAEGVITLRLLTEADLPAYKALRDAMLARHEQAFTSDAETERAREASSYRVRLHPQAGGKSLFTLGAWSGERLVGALTCEHENRKKVMHVAHLIGMMVDDEVRGRGIGKRLLQHQAQAEYYALQGSLPAAIEQLQLARSAGDGDFYQLSVVDARLKDLRARHAAEK